MSRIVSLDRFQAQPKWEMSVKGYWGETKPVLIDLKKCSNAFQFTVKVPNKGLSIRKFKLKTVINQ